MIRPLASIREDLPALARRQDGLPVAYFDGPGGTQVPRMVVEAMQDYLYHHNANTHWAYPTSEETDALLLQARETFATFVNGRATEIVFGPNMTTLTFHLARGLGREWGPGDRVLVTELDHHANRAPWEAMAAERGLTVDVVPMQAESGTLDLDALARLVTPATRVVAVGAASNALGTMTDVAHVARLARSVGALTFVDAVHLAPHALLDVQALGCDFLACSPYKFYGPHAGVLWGREALLATVAVPKLAPAPDSAPERLETGTQSHEAIVGSAAAVRWIAGLAGDGGDMRTRLGEAFAALHERGARQIRRLWDGLQALGRARCYGPPPEHPRTTTISFAWGGEDAEAVARRLAKQGLFVSHGDFYAASVIERLGLGHLGGLVRVGCAAYTSDEEIERLLHALSRG